MLHWVKEINFIAGEALRTKPCHCFGLLIFIFTSCLGFDQRVLSRFLPLFLCRCFSHSWRWVWWNFQFVFFDITSMKLECWWEQSLLAPLFFSLSVNTLSRKNKVMMHHQVSMFWCPLVVGMLWTSHMSWIISFCISVSWNTNCCFTIRSEKKQTIPMHWQKCAVC